MFEELLKLYLELEVYILLVGIGATEYIFGQNYQDQY